MSSQLWILGSSMGETQRELAGRLLWAGGIDFVHEEDCGERPRCFFPGRVVQVAVKKPLPFCTQITRVSDEFSGSVVGQVMSRLATNAELHPVCLTRIRIRTSADPPGALWLARHPEPVWKIVFLPFHGSEEAALVGNVLPWIVEVVRDSTEESAV